MAPAPARRHPSHSSPANVTSRRITSGGDAAGTSEVSWPDPTASAPGVPGGSYAESANETPPHGPSADRSSSVPSGRIVFAPEHSTAISAAGSRTARQSPRESASRTQGEKTIGRTIPASAAGAASGSAAPEERTSSDPAKTYASYGSFGRPGASGPTPRLHHCTSFASRATSSSHRGGAAGAETAEAESESESE